MIHIEPAFLKTLPTPHYLFKQMMSFQGKIYRQLEGRETLAFQQGGENYFIKKHAGIGWREIVKNLANGKLPVCGAKNEWEALLRLKQLHVRVPGVLAYGKKGLNPAKQQSFIVMEAIEPSVSLEDYCRDWGSKAPDPLMKDKLIKEVARMMRLMHQGGINHRDCYICHFLLKPASLEKENVGLFLIDLHRAQIRKKVPYRWRVKDLSGLYFSSMNIGLRKEDITLFLEQYFELPWNAIQKKHHKLLADVKDKAIALYQKEYGEQPAVVI
jgi:heptose I phosphotransferase